MIQYQVCKNRHFPQPHIHVFSFFDTQKGTEKPSLQDLTSPRINSVITSDSPIQISNATYDLGPGNYKADAASFVIEFQCNENSKLEIIALYGENKDDYCATQIEYRHARAKIKFEFNFKFYRVAPNMNYQMLSVFPGKFTKTHNLNATVLGKHNTIQKITIESNKRCEISEFTVLMPS